MEIGTKGTKQRFCPKPIGTNGTKSMFLSRIYSRINGTNGTNGTNQLFLSQIFVPNNANSATYTSVKSGQNRDNFTPP